MGTLYIVATPIGNLEDITLRAINILKMVDLIACEDTRRTKLLLTAFKIENPLVSYHQHSKLQKIEYLISELNKGKNIALVTDAGTPGIADPAGILLAEALKDKIKVVPIPGPSAMTTLVSIAGISTDKFIFLGYLPKKKGRKKILDSFVSNPLPIIFLESPYRIIKTLNELQDILDDREVIIGREMTKKFEEILRGRISQIIKQIRPQGEFIILIKPKEKNVHQS